DAAASEQRVIDSLMRTAEAIGREHKAGAQILTRVGETLQAASGDPEVGEAIENGHLLKEQRSVGLAGGLTVAPPATATAKGKAKAAPAPRPPSAGRPPSASSPRPRSGSPRSATHSSAPARRSQSRSGRPTRPSSTPTPPGGRSTRSRARGRPAA